MPQRQAGRFHNRNRGCRPPEEEPAKNSTAFVRPKLELEDGGSCRPKELGFDGKARTKELGFDGKARTIELDNSSGTPIKELNDGDGRLEELDNGNGTSSAALNLKVSTDTSSSTVGIESDRFLHVPATTSAPAAPFDSRVQTTARARAALFHHEKPPPPHEEQRRRPNALIQPETNSGWDRGDGWLGRDILITENDRHSANLLVEAAMEESKSRTCRQRLLVVANRLPVSATRNGDVWSLELSAGGLVSALLGKITSCVHHFQLCFHYIFLDIIC